MPTSHPIIHVGQPLHASGIDATGSLSLTVLATLTLTPGKKYEGLFVNGHCRLGCLLEVVYNDDGSETPKAHSGSDPGNPDPKISDPNFALDLTGKTGTQELILKFKNFSKASCVRGSLSTREF